MASDRKVNHRRSTGIVAAAVVGAAVLTLSAWPSGSANARGNSDASGSAAALAAATDELKNMSAQAILTDQTVASPQLLNASPVAGLRLAPRAGFAPSSFKRLTPMEISRVKAISGARIRSVFAYAPTVASRESQKVANIAAAEADPNFKFYGSGVSQITTQKVDVTDSSGVATLRVSAWSDFAQKDATGSFVHATPKNDLIVQVSFSKEMGAWRLVDMKWTFAEGSAP